MQMNLAPPCQQCTCAFFSAHGNMAILVRRNLNSQVTHMSFGQIFFIHFKAPCVNDTHTSAHPNVYNKAEIKGHRVCMQMCREREREREKHTRADGTERVIPIGEVHMYGTYCERVFKICIPPPWAVLLQCNNKHPLIALCTHTRVAAPSKHR